MIMAGSLSVNCIKAAPKAKRSIPAITDQMDIKMAGRHIWQSAFFDD